MWKMTIGGLLVLLSTLLVFAEPRHAQNNEGAVQHPYLFLTIPRDRSSAMVHGFEVIQAKKNEKDAASADLVAHEDYDDNEFEEEEHNDNERVNDDSYGDNVYDDVSLNEDDEEEEYEDAQSLQERNPIILKIEADEELGLNFDSGDGNDHKPEIAIMNVAAAPTSVKRNNLQLLTKNTINRKFIKNLKHQVKGTNMMVPHENAGALMVPDGIIEIEGQTIFDKKSGKTTLLVPRSALDAIPNGSVVALMERSMDSGTQAEEERANRVIVRRRRKGSRRNVRRRSGSRRRRGSKRGSRRKNVRIVQVGNNRRRGTRRRQRPLIVQG